MYELQIRALSSVNGVITLTESGTLYSFNENFIEALVGKERKEEALKKDVVRASLLFIMSLLYFLFADLFFSFFA